MRKQVLIEIRLNKSLSEEGVIYVKATDYDDPEFLKKLSLKKSHKSMIDFIKQNFGMNENTIFLIQKIMIQRNNLSHYETPNKISNEEFSEDLARELDDIKTFDPQNKIIACCRAVLLAAQIINNKELEKNSKNLTDILDLNHNSRSKKRSIQIRGSKSASSETKQKQKKND